MTLKPETKICIKCGEEKSLNSFYKDYNSKCKMCCIEYSKKYREQNIDKCHKSGKKYREQNRDKCFEYSRKKHKQNKENLTNTYIRNLLNNGISRIKNKDIPLELIQAKREQIKLFRLIKQIKNELRKKECVTN